MSRGGARNGKPGTSYANRTDLNAHTLPATAVPNQPYGVAGAQLESQKIVPMANAPLPQGQLQPNSQPFQQPQGPQPGSLGDLTDPTQRPNEHFMTGVNAGPGAGSEALTPMLPTSPTATALGLINSLGSNISPQVARIRDYLAAQTENQMPH